MLLVGVAIKTVDDQGGIRGLRDSIVDAAHDSDDGVELDLGLSVLVLFLVLCHKPALVALLLDTFPLRVAQLHRRSDGVVGPEELVAVVARALELTFGLSSSDGVVGAAVLLMGGLVREVEVGGLGSGGGGGDGAG